VSSKVLAARHDLPPRRLEALLQALVRAGVLRSLRGPAGGYELARERRRICVGEIVRVALRLEDDETSTASAGLDALVDPLLKQAEEQALASLDRVTLDDLYARAMALDEQQKINTPGDFII
jgi:Rrf2 family protein